VIFFRREADAIEGIHPLQVFIGNGGDIVEVEPGTELAAEGMLLAPDNLGYGFTLDWPGTVLAMFAIIHYNPPRIILSKNGLKSPCGQVHWYLKSVVNQSCVPSGGCNG
jgi:hypothetical protein